MADESGAVFAAIRVGHGLRDNLGLDWAWRRADTKVLVGGIALSAGCIAASAVLICLAVAVHRRRGLGAFGDEATPLLEAGEGARFAANWAANQLYREKFL